MDSGEDIYQQGERKFDPPQNSTQEILTLAPKFASSPHMELMATPENYTNTDMTSPSILKMTSFEIQTRDIPTPLPLRGPLFCYFDVLSSTLVSP